MDKKDIELMNEKLASKYGTDLLKNPRYRIVFADDQLEKRFGEYTVNYGHIYLRTERGILEVKKYPQFPHMYVLERLCGNESNEIIGQYTYEPLWAFRDGKGNPLPPVYRVAEIVLESVEGYLKTGKMSPSDYMAMEEEEKEKEAELFADMLGEDMRSPLFEDEAAVFIDSTKRLN
jgi:hypothetical protein